MKRWLIVLALLFLGHDSFAGVSCSVPFNLTNGSNADASQVMANYNAILACLLNNTAESGANSSITSLLGLTTPLSPSQGGSSVFTGTGVGTNSITVAASPNGFALTTGYKIIFSAAGGNTAATTLNVSGTGVKNLFRTTPVGIVAMVGGEISGGQIVEAVYDGTEYQMTSTPALSHAPGEVFDYAGAGGCPVGSLLANGAGSAPATLTAILGTTWGVSGTLPDLRGRTTFSADSGGSGRITVAGGNFDGTAVGGTGGQQNKVVAQANLVDFVLADPGHIHSGTYTFNASNISSRGDFQGAGALTGLTVPGTPGVIASPSATTGVHTGGSSTPLPTLSNAAIVLKCVKS